MAFITYVYSSQHSLIVQLLKLLLILLILLIFVFVVYSNLNK